MEMPLNKGILLKKREVLPTKDTKNEIDERNYYQESKGDGCDGRDAV